MRAGRRRSHNPQSLNRYTYVKNNPTTLTDPTGLCDPSAWWCPAAWGSSGGTFNTAGTQQSSFGWNINFASLASSVSSAFGSAQQSLSNAWTDTKAWIQIFAGAVEVTTSEEVGGLDFSSGVLNVSSGMLTLTGNDPFAAYTDAASSAIDLYQAIGQGNWLDAGQSATDLMGSAFDIVGGGEGSGDGSGAADGGDAGGGGGSSDCTDTADCGGPPDANEAQVRRAPFPAVPGFGRFERRIGPWYSPYRPFSRRPVVRVQRPW